MKYNNVLIFKSHLHDTLWLCAVTLFVSIFYDRIVMENRLTDLLHLHKGKNVF